MFYGEFTREVAGLDFSKKKHMYPRAHGKSKRNIFLSGFVRIKPGETGQNWGKMSEMPKNLVIIVIFLQKIVVTNALG